MKETSNQSRFTTRTTENTTSPINRAYTPTKASICICIRESLEPRMRSRAVLYMKSREKKIMAMNGEKE
jgi:hypothetical protein